MSTTSNDEDIRIVPGSYSLFGSGDEDSSDEDAPPLRNMTRGKKRVKLEEVDAHQMPVIKAKRVIKRIKKKCKPGYFHNLPIDILFEISSHLGWRDLFYFSFVSKVIRNLLLANDFSSLWIEARRQVKFPETTIMPMTEQQYATLIFGKTCQSCGSKLNVAKPDLLLRIHWCRDCRVAEWVNRAHVRDLYSHFHPLTFKCALVTLHTAKEADYRSWSNLFCKSSDLFYYDEILQNLQLQDEVEAFESDRNSGIKYKIYDQVIPGGRVETFVNSRVTLVDDMMEEGLKIIQACHDWELSLKRGAAVVKVDNYCVEQKRRRHIENKVKILGWKRPYFTGKWYTSKIINKAEPLTDEIWATIEKSVLKLLESIKQTLEVEQLERRQQSRQDRLKTPYKALRASCVFSKDKDSYPLFGEFLHLPSIQKMWEKEDWKFNKLVWDESLDIIIAEVEQHREKVRILAIKTILASTTLESYEELNNYDDSHFSQDKFDNDFFKKPTSFLFCNLPKCGIKGHSDYNHFGWKWIPPINTYFSSLPELLQHQHLKHRKERFKTYSPGHFHLPESVTFALSAIIEVGRLDEDNVTEGQLDGLGKSLQWLNSLAFRQKYTFRDIIEKVYDKTMHLRKNAVLPIPTIAFTPPPPTPPTPPRRFRDDDDTDDSDDSDASDESFYSY